MIKHLILINVIFYIGSNFLGVNEIAYNFLALHFPLSDNFYVWQIFTHIFMHAEINVTPTHIIFNMLGLYMFGGALEYYWGEKRFLIFYLSCGIGAALLHLGVQYFQLMQFVNNLSLEQIKILGTIDFSLIENYNELNNILIKNKITNTLISIDELNQIIEIKKIMSSSAVGASGALYGILVGYAFMFSENKIFLLFPPIAIKAKYYVSFLVLYDFIAGLSGSSILGGGGIAHFAHVGGAITGFLIMYLWRNKKYNFKRWN